MSSIIVMSSSVLAHQPFYNYFSKPAAKDTELVTFYNHTLIYFSCFIYCNRYMCVCLCIQKSYFTGWKVRHVAWSIQVFWKGSWHWNDRTTSSTPLKSSTYQALSGKNQNIWNGIRFFIKYNYPYKYQNFKLVIYICF